MVLGPTVWEGRGLHGRVRVRKVCLTKSKDETKASFFSHGHAWAHEDVALAMA